MSALCLLAIGFLWSATRSDGIQEFTRAVRLLGLGRTAPAAVKRRPLPRGHVPVVADPVGIRGSTAKKWGLLLLVGLLTGTFLAPALAERLAAGASSEASTNLRGIFTAEKAFFGEYGTYGSDLISVNWRPEGKVRYIVGFCNSHPSPQVPGIPGWDPQRSTSAHPTLVQSGGFQNADPSLHDPCGVLGAMGLAHLFKVTGQSFTAFAIGNIDGDPDLDVWSINEYRELVHVHRD